MSDYVITISRQFGSLGRSIARELSQMLQIEYLDRDIVEETSRRMGLPVSVISEEEEAAKKSFFGSMYPLGVGLPNLKDEIFSVQENIIKDVAKKGPCIIVGRCADYILRENENLLSVYIYASYEQRLNNCISVLEMDEKTALRMIREVDAARENYHKTYIPGYKSPFDNRDLCINAGYFGVAGTAEVIADVVRKRYCKAGN